MASASHPPVPAAAPLQPWSVWRLAASQTWLDFRAGELRLVLVAIVLAVTALTAVGFFADRLQGGLTRDAAQLLGGDLVVQSDHPVPEVFIQQAQTAGMQTSLTASFPSMARAPDERGGAAKLVAVKSVGASYPLRGQLTLRSAPTGPDEAVALRPARGEVFVDVALLDALSLRMGDELLLGDARLRVARLIVIEPDRGAGFLSFAPRVMLNEADLAATGLVQPASRVSYRLAVAAPIGREAGVKPLTEWARAAIRTDDHRGMRVESLEAGRPEMRQTLDRAQKFLNLVALLAALLAAVAVAIAARDFAQRHLDDCAMLRVLGLSQRRIATVFLLEFLLLGLLASVGGVLGGLALHTVFIELLGAFVPASLPAPGLKPALYGLATGLTLLLGFGLPPVLQLARVPPLRVIRRDLGQVRAASLGVWLMGGVAFAALLLTVAQDLTMGLISVGGFAAAIAVFAALAALVVMGLGRWMPESRVPNWLVLATRQVAARPAFAVLQVSSLAVGLMALALLVLLRTDLISSWRQATPPDAPNRFVINVQPDQAADFRATLASAGVADGYDWFPMIRGRLITINGEAVGPRYADNEGARRSIDRELNLSHSAEMPAHNRLVAGEWGSGDAQGLSIEQGLATNLGVALGDELAFDIGGQIHTTRITSIRKVDWGSMRANFFVLYPVAEMPTLPATFLAAYRAPVGDAGFDNRLTAKFPNITNVDVSASLAQVQGILDQVVKAVETLFAFTVAAGLAVLFAAVSATRDTRARDYAVMRACGAGSRLLSRVQQAELLGVGALAGFLATSAAMAVGWALARFVFEFSWTAAWWVPVAGTLAGALLALGAGWWSLRDVLRRPVMVTLRQASQ
ncbi:ABC transporter permease [Ideonella margarita]|uniref:FtsX-like permease family protein n=1 Tax=Ideonella margarita TaxID=2984191 RepID=A0ABU9C8U1_9BURK